MRHRQPIVVVGLFAVVLAALMTAAPTGAASTATGSGSERVSAATKYGRDIVRVTNNKREQHNRRELRVNDCLQKYAVKNARRMARTENMDHQQLDPVAQDCGLRSVSENIAEGYPNGRAAVRAWMHSTEGHREALLNREFRILGAAARKGDNGRWYAAQVFGRKL